MLKFVKPNESTLPMAVGLPGLAWGGKNLVLTQRVDEPFLVRLQPSPPTSRAVEIGPFRGANFFCGGFLFVD